MKKQLKTSEEMAVEFLDRSKGHGLDSSGVKALLAEIIREGGHNPDDEIIRTEIRMALRGIRNHAA